MAYHLIGNDGAVKVTLGGVATGAAPTYNTSNTLVLTGEHMGIEITDSLETVDVAGVGDLRSKFRAKRGKTQITVDKFVLSSGVVWGESTNQALGQYAQFQVEALSSTANTFASYEGLVTEWSHSMPDDAQKEHLVIMCDPEHS